MGEVRTISTPKKICNFSTINAICTCKCNSSFSDIPATTFKKLRSQLREKNLISRRKKSDFRRAEILTEFDEQQHLDSVNFGEYYCLNTIVWQTYVILKSCLQLFNHSIFTYFFLSNTLK